VHSPGAAAARKRRTLGTNIWDLKAAASLGAGRGDLVGPQGLLNTERHIIDDMSFVDSPVLGGWERGKATSHPA
jgi:hypothetical protein